MNHSFLCVPGHRGFPLRGWFDYDDSEGPHDFARFLRPQSDSYARLTFTASTA